MRHSRLALASRGGGKKARGQDDHKLRHDGLLHPEEYLWVMQNKFKPGDDIPQRLIDCYRRAIAVWGTTPTVFVPDFGGKFRVEGPYVI